MPARGRKSSEKLRPRVVEINLLPPEYKQRLKLSLQFLLVALSLMLVLPLYPLAQWRVAAGGEASDIKVQLDAQKRALSSLTTLEPRATQLQADIDQARGKLEAMDSDYEAFLAQRVKWSQALKEILDFPEGVTLGPAISQGSPAPEVTVEGIAPDFTTVANYANRLRASGIFSSVTIETGSSSVVGISFRLILQARSES